MNASTAAVAELCTWRLSCRKWAATIEWKGSCARNTVHVLKVTFCWLGTITPSLDFGVNVAKYGDVLFARANKHLGTEEVSILVCRGLFF